MLTFSAVKNQFAFILPVTVISMKGMGICTDLHAITYIVFCKTKSANVEFYRWFFKKVFVKFILPVTVISMKALL